jgi:hypothetical protein
MGGALSGMARTPTVLQIRKLETEQHRIVVGPHTQSHGCSWLWRQVICTKSECGYELGCHAFVVYPVARSRVFCFNVMTKANGTRDRKDRVSIKPSDLE